ncbi:MAG: UDP-N-acetylmuramoylalanine-D-glutamate ligase [Candidatus Nomurabacteria bacterium GW2011_GWF2_35_66]|uniref:UDP-N-acetylmuramoylalanine--D-glutamate ligase n=1 Tax=Candidatus Nomurabacteria bacterium GW2011_GWE1_35_16 TaxID=1618761 RepID=A0A0G0DTF5_9BACT|nr:MAG: UDP-N-acetylmuramoylalanine-D-glutamate ligase [Candidatus Nomurabacteria bacterium GW2011_GWF1_34_20]KKP62866.1 MAG: UDP-N-acetylmuramoylalanine-D-glutamate ligase [Candidatus Nomurabacteria bacterium GW2011_GWE2_34_25]KKP66265.1 MAG: UDP-N-acetylmuramoylalanine-D-glutamate ligase [Candidatus Nomurabacteria bacterium GW2011_GWE1_35_16]KKP83098.1 MAG: UDP-N-acetylmuramoylalanine-D-glutamate ligase [Candidatus Nomurabacteria bacterium GW2011_GWF2_35_66]
MGLGLLGRGLGYTKFLAECGADLTVTDLKTKEQLKASVEAIKNYELKIKNKNKIKFVLGEHRLEDFRDRDMIVKNPGIPLDSIYIKEARKNGIPVEMDVSLFAKCTPEVMIIGVTGTRGKSMTTTLIYEILKANEKFLKKNVYVGGNLRGVATLPLLKKVKAGDILVCELDSWQLQGFGEAHISPQISVFTTFMPDHMNYYKDSMEKYFDDKANIFKYQKSGDTLVILPDMKKWIKKEDVNGKLIIADKKNVDTWKFNVKGDHHRNNLACAVKVAEVLGIPEIKIKKVVSKFEGLEGRLQLLKIYKGIKIYNDNNATTPEATIAGLEALVSPRHGLGERKIVLICGGADKGLNLDNFTKAVNKYCKAAVMIPGTGTERLITNYQLLITNEVGRDLKDIVKTVLGKASRGDIILFSPAFASFGMFNNEYERNDLFMKIIKKLK